MRVFVSFTAIDKPKAIEIAEKLRGWDFEVFVGSGGESLPHGKDYDDRIKTAISKCDVFVFLISPTSIEAGRYTQNELEWARARWPNPKKHVLPVFVTKTPFADIPPYLTQAVTVLEPKGNLPTTVLETVQELSRALTREQRAAVGKKLVGGLFAIVLMAAGIWFATKTQGGDVPQLVDAGVLRDVDVGVPKDAEGRKDAIVGQHDVHKDLLCLLDRDTGKPCPTKKCPAGELLYGEDLKHWKKDHKQCGAISLCRCLPH